MIHIQTISVPEFMKALLVTEPHFPAEYWYFRGHADATWGLVPSSRRQETWDRFGGAERHRLCCQHGRVVSSDGDLRFVEQSLEDTLSQIIERTGLPVHLLSGSARTAFARHIGLPTRVLDWTRSAWTAAYFAAAGAATRIGEDGDLAVFAMSTIFLENSERMQGCEKLTIAAAGNPNIVAQQGVLLRMPGDVVDMLDGFQFVTKPAGYRPTAAEGAAIDNQFLKITLPWSYAEPLLRQLRAQELHGATIYPGQAGVAELVREVFISEAVRSGP